MNRKGQVSALKRKSFCENNITMDALQIRVMKKIKSGTSLVKQVNERSLQLLSKGNVQHATISKSQTEGMQTLHTEHCENSGTSHNKIHKANPEDAVRKLETSGDKKGPTGSGCLLAEVRIATVIDVRNRLEKVIEEPSINVTDSVAGNRNEFVSVVQDPEIEATDSVVNNKTEFEADVEEPVNEVTDSKVDNRNDNTLVEDLLQKITDSNVDNENEYETVVEKQTNEDSRVDEEIPMQTYLDYIKVLKDLCSDSPELDGEDVADMEEENEIGTAYSTTLLHPTSDRSREDERGCLAVEDFDVQNEFNHILETDILAEDEYRCDIIEGRLMEEIKLTDDQLDYIEAFDFIQEDEVEELLCISKRGRGSLHPRRVPRLPLKAMIQRLKILDDPARGGRRAGRGRARLLEDRARTCRPDGLHKKKVERLVMDREEEPVKRPTEDAKDKVRYNGHWSENDFPNLCTGPRVNHPTGQRLEKTIAGKKHRMLETERKTDLASEDTLDDTNNRLADVQLDNEESEKIKPVKKKRFDFSKANQELLQEFPIFNQNRPKIMSLTQHNLEKFLRESDSESCSSQENLHSSNRSYQELPENAPMYEKYAVTLDDIRKSKASKVPPKVKGHLADLLEAIDTYCNTPNIVLEKQEIKHRNKETNISGDQCQYPNANLVPNNNQNVDNDQNVEAIATVIKTSNDQEEQGVPSDPAIDTVEDVVIDNETEDVVIDNETEDVVIDNETEEAVNDNQTVSNVSIVSDLSSLNSPTENEFESSIDKLMEINEHTDDVKMIEEQSENNFIDMEKTPSDLAIWRVYGLNAIQVDGIPLNSDISELHGMVAGFGTVLDFQTRNIDSNTSVRFKLHSVDACEYAMQCLDGTDCLFPESYLTCHQLQV